MRYKMKLTLIATLLVILISLQIFSYAQKAKEISRWKCPFLSRSPGNNLCNIEDSFFLLKCHYSLLK